MDRVYYFLIKNFKLCVKVVCFFKLNLEIYLLILKDETYMYKFMLHS